jgi:hypothetical protein
MRASVIRNIAAGLAELSALVAFTGMILVWADSFYRL